MVQKLPRLSGRNWLNIFAAFIILSGLSLRYLHLRETAFFNADQEDFAWKSVRIIKEGKPVLIGLKAGEFPVFIGPLMYYVYALFYFLFNMNPFGLSYFNLLLSLFTLISVYWVGKKLFSQKTALWALIIYAFSYFFIEQDRRVWLVTPLIPTSLWLLYCLYRFKLAALGLLLSLSFQFHLTALIFWPLTILGLSFNRRKNHGRAILITLLFSLIGFLPVLVFDLRHQFINLRGWSWLLSQSGRPPDYFSRLSQLLALTAENLLRLLPLTLKQPWLLFITMAVLGFLVIKKSYLYRLFFFWLLVPLLIFLPTKIHVPEYYLTLTYPVLLFVIAITLSKVSQGKLGKIIVLLLLLVFLWKNGQLFQQESRPGQTPISLANKLAATEFIINKAEGQGLTVNYFAQPAHRFGFDYLFYWQLGYIPQEKLPADFSLVVPWDYQNLKITHRFGGIGVIANP